MTTFYYISPSYQERSFETKKILFIWSEIFQTDADIFAKKMKERVEKLKYNNPRHS